MEFKTEFGEETYKNKYQQFPGETWGDRARTVVNFVCGDMHGATHPLMDKEDQAELVKCIENFEFMPGGRYLWYAGRKAPFLNNCYLLRLLDDTREEWAGLTQRAMSCLMTGGGIGVDISVCRPSGRVLERTGGISSGPLPLLYTINEVGRNVMQGGSRRSAMYGSMDASHEDIWKFLHAKNWGDMPVQGAFNGDGTPMTVADAKREDFNYPAPLDMMNISVNYSDNWLNGNDNDVFMENCKQAMKSGEPGFSFNFGDKKNETLRNACCEIVSSDDSDVCNLGSVNMANIESIERFKEVVALASKFLVCGLMRANLPYEKVGQVRQKNSRLGLGLMGVHEWLLTRDYRYEMVDELKKWMKVYESESKRSADAHCKQFYLNCPQGYRAIAPTGTISILAGTTGGLETVHCLAYRRRYLTDGTRWKYQYVIDGTAQALIDKGIDPAKIETSMDLAQDVERRVRFQYEMQKHVDHAVSSTINLPPWGTEFNNEDHVDAFSRIVRKYGHGLRGLTFYPDGSRGGQPIQAVPYEEAHAKRGVVYEDNSEEQCLSGVCNV